MGNTKSVIIPFGSTARMNARLSWLMMANTAETDWEEWLKNRGGEMVNHIVLSVADIKFAKEEDAVAFILAFG